MGMHGFRLRTVETSDPIPMDLRIPRKRKGGYVNVFRPLPRPPPLLLLLLILLLPILLPSSAVADKSVSSGTKSGFRYGDKIGTQSL